ncbi:non-ribosomal peptide synthetase [Actinoplanes sp. N902-109]|uniref:non-ribosomal peptide synthetase n=1 Tax=Actinoplanes sp. (strain N902-109) TaxID=649831 RepID=UPI00032964A4|nr:non-ribosomal peptide synthetase [Actinoplanes sp. N902-109]AGL16558.1 amino acid adenylation [Actinoplanes sp. N902-109]
MPADDVLSYPQESLWLVHQMADRDEPAYNETVAFRLTGPVDAGALGRAVDAVIARHDALRTSFHETPGGPRARVADAVPPALHRDGDLTGFARRPFDLTVAPLIRALLLAQPDGTSIFALTAHHIVIDDWSLRLVLAEIGDCYRSLVTSGGLPQAEPPAVRFADVARAARAAADSGEYAEPVERWRQSLRHSPELLGMPLDRPRPARPTFRGAGRTLTVPAADVDPLLEVCRRECGSTAYPVFLAAYALLLSRCTGQDGVAIGGTVLNRETEDELAVVGCCVNTLPLFVPVDPDATFRQLLGAAQEATDRLLDDGAAPFPKVLEALGTPRAANHHPVFQTVLTMLGPPPDLDLGSGVAARTEPVDRTGAKFDLMLYVSTEPGGYQFEIEVNTDLFDPHTAERLLGNYAQLLRALAAGLDLPVSEPSMLRAEEKHLILDSWNDTAVAHPAGTVPDFIEQQVRRTPDAPAVEGAGLRLTYDELDRRANHVARRLQDRLGPGPRFVGVYMDRSADMVIALLAIVKAGHAYVPIDPDYPAARVEFLIADAGLPLVLTQPQHLERLHALGAPALVLPTGSEAGPVRRDLRPGSPVYMIYTSGSTGRPKGVVNRHDALANRLLWMQAAFRLGADDRVLQKTPYSFDVSVWEFFWPLMTGAAIVVAEPGGHRDPEYLKRTIQDHGVTTVHFVPSMLNVFLETGGLAQACGSLRRVICSGEALPRRSVEVFFATLGCELHNLYGPTEAAIDVSHWPCTLDYPGDIVPIGRPIDNVRLYVLDRHRRLQPVGVPGELCIGGVAVASGYHRRAELTSTVFVEDPYGTGPDARLYRTGDLARFLPDGQIQYLGRIDNQVKLRGLRIEPDEVAAVLRGLPGVRDAAVVVYSSGATQALTAYVVLAGATLDELRTGLRRLLPEFLVPQFLVEVPGLPTTPNGKLDRRALPDPAGAAAAAAAPGAAPATGAEQDVARVWQEVLGTGAVSADSGFFALGGDSILALRAAARLRDAGYAVQIHDLFAHPTVAGLAAALHRGPAAAEPVGAAPFSLLTPADRALLPADAQDAWPLTSLQGGMIYHALLDERSPVYHDIFDYEIAGAGSADVCRAVRETVARHPQLRSVFDLERYTEPLQVVRRGAEPAITVEDLTGRTAGDQDDIIESWRDQQKRTPVGLGGPLIRFAVHVRSRDRVNLGLSFHHLILDGWSVALIVEEIRRRCSGSEPGEPAALPGYGTYVRLERDTAGQAQQRAAWQRLLDGFPPTLLAGPRASVATAAELATATRIVPPELAERLRRRAAQLAVPLKSVYLAAHCAALAGRSGTTRVVTGLVTNGRPEIAGGTEMTGLFLNTVPFPVGVPADPGAGLVTAVFEREQELLPHARFPLARIEQLHGGALFDVAFNYTDFHVYQATGEQVRIERATYFELTSFPMVVHVHHDRFTGTTELTVNHDLTSIKTATAERLLDDVLGVLERLAAPPDIAGIIAGVLGRTDLGVDTNYLDAGVDSITSIRVLAKLRMLFPAATLLDVIEARTVRELARRLEQQAGTAGQVATSRDAGAGPGGASPVTAMQLRMIRATQREPAQSAFHDVFAYTVDLPFDEAALRTALRRVTAAGETLRTSFDLTAEPPLQHVHPAVEPRLTVVDARDRPGAADEWFSSERGSGFRWDEPGLIRYAAHRTCETRFVLTLSFHHAILDGWSLSLIIRDLLRSYAALLAGAPPPPPDSPDHAFHDYVRAEVAARSDESSRAFWRDLLDGHPGTSLPSYPPDPAGRRWTETTVVVPAALEDRLRTVAQLAGCSLKHLMLAVHLRTLSLLTGTTDVVTGVFTHGRLETADSDRMTGMFLHFQPHRARLHEQNWPELTEQVFRAEARALPHRRCSTPDQPLPALFNYTEFPAYDAVAEHLAGVRWFEHADTPYLVTVGRSAGLEITVNADGRLLPQSVVDHLGCLWRAVLTDLAERPTAAVLDPAAEVRAVARLLRTEGNPLS